MESGARVLLTNAANVDTCIFLPRKRSVIRSNHLLQVYRIERSWRSRWQNV